jgi:oligopeptide transport system ATP-binding protein
MSENGYLLEVQDLKKYFFTRRFFSSDRKPVRAVDGISFSIRKGETLGLVGESGCGKTTAGKSVLRLIEPTSGAVLFKGVDIRRLEPEPLRALRRQMQYIFQDPYESLNPRMKVNEIVGEGLEVHRIARGREKNRRVSETLVQVGLHPQDASRYAHEFSGGQRQRIGIARAVALHPELIIADEPVSALDVSIQAQILNLLSDLRDQLSLTYIFISHDLRVVKHISDRIAVMYLGKIVEMADKEDLFARPLHPYTRLLLEAIPKMRTRRDQEPRPEQRRASGDSGKACQFQPNCPHPQENCETEEPSLLDMGEGHLVSCHFFRGPSR